MTDETVDSHAITSWLGDWQKGDECARDRLFAAVQPHLRQLAARYLHRERGDHTLEPNALVNELCLRLLGTERLAFNDRVHFFAMAAQIMRRILIDHARARVAEKRGGPQHRVSLSAVDGWQVIAEATDLVALDQALVKFETVDSRAAQVVVLRFFGGLTEEEVAQVLGVAPITVKRDWKVARAWLISRLQPRT